MAIEVKRGGYAIRIASASITSPQFWHVAVFRILSAASCSFAVSSASRLIPAKRKQNSAVRFPVTKIFCHDSSRHQAAFARFNSLRSRFSTSNTRTIGVTRPIAARLSRPCRIAFRACASASARRAVIPNTNGQNEVALTMSQKLIKRLPCSKSGGKE